MPRPSASAWQICKTSTTASPSASAQPRGAPVTGPKTCIRQGHATGSSCSPTSSPTLSRHSCQVRAGWTANASGPISALTQYGRSRSPGTFSTRRCRSSTPRTRSRISRTTPSMEIGGSGASKHRTVKTSLACDSETQYSFASAGDNLRTSGRYHVATGVKSVLRIPYAHPVRHGRPEAAAVTRSSARRSIPR